MSPLDDSAAVDEGQIQYCKVGGVDSTTPLMRFSGYIGKYGKYSHLAFSQFYGKYVECKTHSVIAPQPQSTGRVVPFLEYAASLSVPPVYKNQYLEGMDKPLMYFDEYIEKYGNDRFEYVYRKFFGRYIKSSTGHLGWPCMSDA